MKNPNGYGSIIKLGGNRRKPYAVRFTVGYKDNGSAVYKYQGYFTNLKDAKTFLTNYNRNPYQLESPTFSQVWELFSEDVLTNTKTGTALQRTVAFNHFEPIHDIPFAKLKPIDLQRCIDKFESPSVQANMRSTYGAMEHYALKCEIVSKSISNLIDTKPIQLKFCRNFFTEEEIKVLWEHSDETIIKDALILIYTGWRISEYLSLQKADIKDGCMYGGGKTEAGRNRCVPIHPRIMPLVQEKLDTSRSSALCGYYCMNTFRYQWRKNELLNKHVIHETRHTFRTRLDNENANKVCIDLLMGHKNGSVGERFYTHKSIMQLKQTINLLR